MRTALGIALLALLTGCAEDPFRAVYDGVKNRNEALKTPSDRAMSSPAPSYDAYRKEREQREKSSE